MQNNKHKASIDSEKQIKSAGIAEEIDERIARAIQGSRPIGELDGKATTLMLVAITLIAISLLKKLPKEIDMLGFKFESVDWVAMVLPLSATIIYLAMHLIMQWWSEKHLWDLGTVPSIIDSRNRIQELLERHDIFKSDWLKSVEVLQEYILSKERLIPDTLEYPHKDFDPASPDEVKTTLNEKINAEYIKMKAMGIFRHIPEENWKASMNIARDYEIKRAEFMQSGGDSDGNLLMIEIENKIAGLRQYPIHPIDGKADEELQFDKKIVNYCIVGIGRVNRILLINRIRLWTVLIIPVSLAAFSLCIMIAQIYARY